MKIEKVNIHNNKVLHQTKMQVYLCIVEMTSLMELHQVTCNVFADSVSQQEVGSLIFKTRINDLEDTLNMGPLLLTSLETRTTMPEITICDTSDRFSKSISFLNVVKTYIISNICQ